MICNIINKLSHRPLDCRKQIPAVTPAAYLGAAAIGGLGNVVQGLFGSSAQDRANETNIMLAREGRDWQSAENQKARDFQLEMWNRQNEYNSPKNQRRLAEEGGYNPYLLGNENLGSGAGSAGVPSMSGAPDVAKVSPVNPASGFGAGFSAFSDMVRLLPQVEQVESNKQLQSMQALDFLSETMLRLYKDGGQKQVDEFMQNYAPLFKSLNFEGSYYEQRVQREFLRMDIENDRADLERSLLEKFGAEEYKKKFAQIDQLISESAAKIQLMESQGRVNEGTLWKMGYEVGKLLAESNYLGAQATQISTLLPYLSVRMKNEAIQSGYQSDIMRYDSNVAGMDFLDRAARFAGDKSVRELMQTGAYQSSQAWKLSVNENHVMSFVKGVGSALGSVMNPLKFTPLMPQSGNNYLFQPSFGQ